MSTLFTALLNQHARTLKPMRYAEPMIAQLQNFFEEVVLENSLQALVVESLPMRSTRSMREIERVRRITRSVRYPFFMVSPDDELTYWAKNAAEEIKTKLILLPNSPSDNSNERFVVISDTHFSALIAAVDAPETTLHIDQQVIYTFDPDIIYTALQYLGARFAAQYPDRADEFMNAMHHSMPKSTSLHLTLSVTTKLASLWQEQTGREIAVNRISTAIRQSLELDEVLQTAVNEVGAALEVKMSALLIEAEENEALSVVYFRDDLSEKQCATIRGELEIYRRRLRKHSQNHVRDGSSANGWQKNPQIVIPLSFLGQFLGVFFVQANTTMRIWQESEILLLQTVADQVAVAIKHARLYVKSQQEALRDGLTGVFNRRFFEMQFEREIKLAERKNSTFSLIMIDVDEFKSINDTYGHTTGDRVLRLLAQMLKKELRAFDTFARYGGEEFVVILPQITPAEAQICAERLRRCVAEAEIPEVNSVTASFGIAVYPQSAQNMLDLLKVADKALYRAKRKGRNRVCSAPDAADETAYNGNGDGNGNSELLNKSPAIFFK